MARQQQHIIGLTEFLMTDGKVYPTRDRAVQLLKSFDRNKDFDEKRIAVDAFSFGQEISTEMSEKSRSQVLTLGLAAGLNQSLKPKP